MRAVTEAFAATLSADVTALALCWRIVRADGVALGFTTHDQAIVIDGLVYRSAPGIAPSAVSTSDRFDVDTMEVTGALSADAIAAADLEAGRFDGARIDLFMASWEQPDAGRMIIARGTIGEIERRDGMFTAELRGPTSQLEAVPIDLTSPECRASFGDRRCRVDPAKHTRLARISAIFDATTVAIGGGPFADGQFAYGRLRAIEGASAGRDVEIMRSEGATLFLREPIELAIADRIEMRDGCDKRFATCRDRFANALNFRGEPHVPGNDAVMRYPSV